MYIPPPGVHHEEELVVWDDKKGRPQSWEALWFDAYGREEFAGYGATAEEAKADLLAVLCRKCAALERVMRVVKESGAGGAVCGGSSDSGLSSSAVSGSL